MTEIPADYSVAPQLGDATATPADLWLGRQLWRQRVEHAGVTTGAGGALRRAGSALPLLAALQERQRSATAHLGRNADRAPITAASNRVLEPFDTRTGSSRGNALQASLSPVAAASAAPVARFGDALPPETRRASPPAARGQVIQRRALAANSGVSPLPRTTAAAADQPARAARPAAAIVVPASDVMPASRRVSARRVGAPVRGAVADLNRRADAGRPMPEQSHQITPAEPFVAAGVTSPNRPTMPSRDLPVIRAHEAADAESDASSATSHRTPPAATAAHQAMAVASFDAKPIAQRPAARSEPTAALRGGSMPVPTVAIAAPMVSGSLPGLPMRPLSVRAATIVKAASSLSGGREAAMPPPPNATAVSQPVQRSPREAQAGRHKQVGSMDTAAPVSTAALSGSVATPSTERARLGAPEIGRVAERVYQLLVDRLAQERQRRGA
jgi:hypothetical protein